MSGEEPRRARPRWRAAVKAVLAVGILALVATQVPWRDTLIWTSGEGGSTELAGRIQGDWKRDAVEFAAGPGELDRGGLPEAFREALVEPGILRADRPPAGEEVPAGQPAWSWRPGMLRVFGELETSGVVEAFAWLLLGLAIVTLRWWRLLEMAGCRTGLLDSFRLNCLGLFFNIVVPGLTGGDWVKAVLAVRENPGQRARAFVSVFVDRIVGLLALMLIAAAVILVVGGPFSALRLPVLLALSAMVVAVVVYASSALRRLVRLDALLKRLPLGGLIRKVDEAVLIYSRRPADMALALLLSFGNHAAVILGTLALGRAFGDTMPTVHYFAVVPIANTVSSLPISPGGWGLGEAAYGYLFQEMGYLATIGVAVSITFRLCMTALGLLGGLFLLVPGSRAELEEVRAQPPSAIPE